MGLYPLHISKVVAVAIVSMWSVSSAPVWKKMIVVIVVKTSLGAEFLCCSNQHYCEFSCGELLHEYILATVIRACMHLGGLNQAFVNLIDFASLVFTTFALHQSLDSLLDFTHPTYYGIGKLNLTRNVAARELFGIYFHSIQFHVIAYVSIDAAVEKSLTMYVASSPRVNFVCKLIPSKKFPHGWVVTSGSRNDNYSAVDLVNIVFFGMLDHTNSSIFKYENQLNMSQVADELAVSFDYQAPGYLTIDRELLPSIQIKVYCNVVYQLFLLVRALHAHTDMMFCGQHGKNSIVLNGDGGELDQYGFALNGLLLRYIMGICYWHEKLKLSTIHQNIKSSSIILREGVEAKVSGFKLLKSRPIKVTDEDNINVILSQQMLALYMQMRKEYQWDPGGNGYYAHDKGSVPFKQWDLGGYSVVQEKGSLDLGPSVNMSLSTYNIILTSTLRTRLF